MQRGLKSELGRAVKFGEAKLLLAARGLVLPDANDWREARKFARAVRRPPDDDGPEQLWLFDPRKAA